MSVRLMWPDLNHLKKGHGVMERGGKHFSRFLHQRVVRSEGELEYLLRLRHYHLPGVSCF